jgi:hypothetical protein
VPEKRAALIKNEGGVANYLYKQHEAKKIDL